MRKDQRYSTGQWRNLRLLVLERDEWRCQIPHDGCKFQAPYSLRSAGPRVAQVHHLIDPIEGGAFYDERNLRATCATFNIGERNRRQNRRAASDVAARAGVRLEPVLDGRTPHQAAVAKTQAVIDRDGGYTGTIANGASRDW